MDKVIFIIGIFVLAIVLRRCGVVRENHAGHLVRYVMALSLPCLTLVSIGTLRLRQAHLETAVIAWLVMATGVLLSYCTGKFLGFTGKRLRVFILVSTFPNTAFLGYPFAYSLFGGDGLSYAIIYDQIGMFPLFLTLGLFIAGGREGISQLPSFPPLIALIAAIALNRAGLPPSGLFARVLGAIGWTTLPMTIFIIGLKVRFAALRDIKGVTASIILRMLIMPAFLFISLHFLGLKGLPYNVAILETAMPPALITGIVSMQYRLDEDLAVSCISVGTVISLILFSIAMLAKG
jgi:predicted permease